MSPGAEDADLGTGQEHGAAEVALVRPALRSGLHPALLDPGPLVGGDGVGERDGPGRRRGGIAAPGRSAGDLAAAQVAGAAEPVAAALPPRRAARARAAAVLALPAEAVGAAPEDVGVVADAHAVEPAASEPWLADRPAADGVTPAAIAGPAASVAAARQPGAAVAIARAAGVDAAAATVAVPAAGARQPVAGDVAVRGATALPRRRASPPTLDAGGTGLPDPEAGEQPGNAARREPLQGLAPGRPLSQPVHDHRQPVEGFPVHVLLLGVL